MMPTLAEKLGTTWDLIQSMCPDSQDHTRCFNIWKSGITRLPDLCMMSMAVLHSREEFIDMAAKWMEKPVPAHQHAYKMSDLDVFAKRWEPLEIDGDTRLSARVSAKALMLTSRREIKEGGHLIWTLSMNDNDTCGFIVPGVFPVNNAGFFVASKPCYAT